jgi:hypothetical protein
MSVVDDMFKCDVYVRCGCVVVATKSVRVQANSVVFQWTAAGQLAGNSMTRERGYE